MLFFLLVSFAISFVSMAWLIWYGRTHAQRYGEDMPQRFHIGYTPRLGGLGMLLSYWLGGLLALWFGGRWGVEASYQQVILPLYLLTPAVLCGIAEDWCQCIPVRWRLLATLLSAIGLCLVMGLHIPRLDIALLDSLWLSAPWLGWMLAILAIGGLPHAFNIIDGYNGLAGMVALLVGMALIYVSLLVGDRVLAAQLVVFLGATAGFLTWNYPHGKIFAGDGGAYLWGLVLAYGSVTLVYRHPQVSPWFPMLLLCYPVFETLFSVYRKKIRGQSPGQADALHLHQLIFRRMVRAVLDSDDEAEEMLKRNNRISPYLWGMTLLTVIPAALFWDTSWLLILYCVLFITLYIWAYLSIVRFKLPIKRW